MNRGSICQEVNVGWFERVGSDTFYIEPLYYQKRHMSRLLTPAHHHVGFRQRHSGIDKVCAPHCEKLPMHRAVQNAIPKIRTHRIAASDIVAFSSGTMGERRCSNRIAVHYSTPNFSGLLAPAKPAPPG